MPSIRSFVLIIGLVISPVSIASAEEFWEKDEVVGTARSAWNTGIPIHRVEDGVLISKAVGLEGAAILRDGTIISKQTDGWLSFFVVKWKDTIADCLVSTGSIQCYYPFGWDR